jgi:hypothetical protein
MIIQRAWASIIGLASAAIGLLRLFSLVTIPLTDALIHILTGILFIAGAWIQKGKYVKPTNLSLGVVYFVWNTGRFQLAAHHSGGDIDHC